MIFPALFSPILAATVALDRSHSDAQIEAMAVRVANAAQSMRAQGVEPGEYFSRLVYLDQRLANVPRNAPPQLEADLQTQKSLEFQLDDRLISGKPLPLPVQGSATDRLYAHPGKAPDPIGVYVPQPNAAGCYGLVVLIHGMGQTETDVISRQVFHRLADTYHAILLAPYNGGKVSWSEPDIDDLMTLVDKMRRLFPVDNHNVYLVGMSIGGAGAFHIAARRADRFAALMTIAGSLDPADAASARLAMRDRPVYMVSGGADPIVTPAVESQTYAALARGCVAVAQYVAPGAGHDLYATADQVERAWGDMFSSVIRSTNTRECSGTPGGIGP